MTSRRRFLRVGLGGFAAVAGPVLVATGCTTIPFSPGPFISDLDVSRSDIVPDGSGVHDETDVFYTLTKRAEVSAMLVAPDGKTTYTIRDPQIRAPDRYEIPFRGLVRVPNTNWLRVVSDGVYKLVVRAKDEGGVVITRETTIKVTGADTAPPELTDLYVSLSSFSPNGDGIDDTVKVSYRLTKESEVRVYATDVNNSFFLVSAPETKHAALQSFEWTGTAAGGTTVLPDGKYLLHIEATDTAGNFTDVTAPVAIEQGGTPRVEITDARFSPTALAVGMDLSVSITVKNTGTVPIRTLGPPPGTKYSTQMNFSSFRDPSDATKALYYERPGVWRVGVSWQNAPQSYPVRWGFFADPSGKVIPDRQLLPGETVTIDGTITVVDQTQHSQVFYAGLEQGGVGFPGGQVGFKQVTISF